MFFDNVNFCTATNIGRRSDSAGLVRVRYYSLLGTSASTHDILSYAILYDLPSYSTSNIFLVVRLYCLLVLSHRRSLWNVVTVSIEKMPFVETGSGAYRVSINCVFDAVFRYLQGVMAYCSNLERAWRSRYYLIV